MEEKVNYAIERHRRIFVHARPGWESIQDSCGQSKSFFRKSGTGETKTLGGKKQHCL